MFERKYTIDILREMNFGLLTVVDELEPKIYKYDNRVRKARMMCCNCSCGKKGIIVSLNNLIRHHTNSCGCYKDSYAKQFLKNYDGVKVERIF